MKKRSSQSNIYTNIYKEVVSTDYFLYIYIGGRGIGKTYSMLQGSYEHGDKIIYLRRTDKILDKCCSNSGNPYKKINIDHNYNIYIEKSNDIYIINDGNKEPKESIGYGLSLSTFGNLRGVDFSDVDIIFFDEFINISPVKTIKGESTLMFDLIETVNRNRELEGMKPIKIVLSSNAQTIDDDILRTLMLADKIQLMKEKNEELYVDEYRGIFLKLLENKTVRDLKKKTRLYRLTEGTTFYEMALNNEFTKDFFGDIGRIDYRELKPLCSYDKYYFYEHKSKDILFVSYRRANCKHYDNRTIKIFKRDFGFRILWYMESGTCFYADYNIKLSVKEIFKNG